MTNHNLFEELAHSVGCLYLSDMKYEPYTTCAKAKFRNCFFLRNYSLSELSDLYRYLYNKERDFSSYEEAEKAFRK